MRKTLWLRLARQNNRGLTNTFASGLLKQKSADAMDPTTKTMEKTNPISSNRVKIGTTTHPRNRDVQRYQHPPDSCRCLQARTTLFMRIRVQTASSTTAPAAIQNAQLKLTMVDLTYVSMP